MASINDIIDAVADTLESHASARCVGLVDNPPVPCVMVYPDENVGDTSSYYSAFQRGLFEVDIVAHVLYPTSALRSSAAALNDNISPHGTTSIPRAVYEHPTLGTDPNESTAGTPTMTAAVARVEEYGMVTAVDGTRLIGAKVIIKVSTRGDT